MKNLLLWESKPEEALRIKALVQSHLQECGVTICSSENELREQASIGDYKVIIASISGNDEANLSVLRWIRCLPKYQMTWIIILADQATFLYNAVRDIHCFDFILKPIKDDDLLHTLEQVICSTVVTDTSSNFLTMRWMGVLYKIRLNDIQYIEINSKNMDIHTAAKAYSIKRYPLSKIKERLPSSLFLQCHRSYIVNISKVSSIKSKNRETFLLINDIDKPIPVGIRYKDLFAAKNILESETAT